MYPLFSEAPMSDWEHTHFAVKRAAQVENEVQRGPLQD